MSPVDSLKKILDVEDRTTRHELFKRWIQSNVTYVQASQPVLSIKKVPIHQRDEIVEALAHEIAKTLLSDNYIAISSDDKSIKATVTFLKRIT